MSMRATWATGEIGGVNTYAKSLRGYRDLLIGHLKGGAA
jgi:hypothetical protein